jgi:hypothetical protein
MLLLTRHCLLYFLLGFVGLSAKLIFKLIVKFTFIHITKIKYKNYIHVDLFSRKITVLIDDTFSFLVIILYGPLCFL